MSAPQRDLGLGTKGEWEKYTHTGACQCLPKEPTFPNPCPQTSQPVGRATQAGAQLVAMVQVQAPREGSSRAPSFCAGHHRTSLALCRVLSATCCTDSQEKLCSVTAHFLSSLWPFCHWLLSCLSPANRLGRVCRQPGARLLAGCPVHQPGGLLHLPVPDGQGRQPRASRPGLRRCVLPAPSAGPCSLWGAGGGRGPLHQAQRAQCRGPTILLGA